MILRDDPEGVTVDFPCCGRQTIGKKEKVRNVGPRSDPVSIRHPKHFKGWKSAAALFLPSEVRIQASVKFPSLLKSLVVF